MSAPHRCGHCSRPIIAGDAYQCTRCSSLFHATCWAGEPRCTCSSTTSRVVHVGPGGRIEVTAPPAPRPAAGRTSGVHQVHGGGGYTGQRRPSQGPIHDYGSPPPRRDPTAPGADVELECPHCMLPIDSLDAPCPFCGRMPRTGGSNVMIIDNEGPSTPAPFGVQAISLLDRIGAIFCWFSAAMLLIPAFAEAEVGLLFASAFFASMGYLGWRLGGDLLKRKTWARTTQTVFAVLQLFGFPVGTVVGSLYLWGLHSEQAERYFDERPLLPEK